MIELGYAIHFIVNISADVDGWLTIKIVIVELMLIKMVIGYCNNYYSRYNIKSVDYISIYYIQ